MGRVIYPISGGAPPPVPGPSVPGPPVPAIPGPVASPAGAIPGSVWVEGAQLHYIASTGQEWAGTGIAISTPPGAVPGSLWPDGEDVFYIDETGIKRQLQRTGLGAKAAPAVTGSNWVDSSASAGKQLEWIGTATRWQWWNGS